MLDLRNISAGYGNLQVLRDVSAYVGDGEIVALLGPNGSGKSTLMNSISRLVQLFGGEIHFDGTIIHELPGHKILGKGISHILERHRLFPQMSVIENLQLGAGPRSKSQRVEQGLEQVYSLFPRLAERRKQMAESLSGGEQQMCAIARGLMSQPKLLLIDEPFIGLSPLIREEVAKAILSINKNGVAVLLIEQNVAEALDLSHRTYVLRGGYIVHTGDSSKLRRGSMIRDMFLGRFPSMSSIAK